MKVSHKMLSLSGLTLLTLVISLGSAGMAVAQSQVSPEQKKEISKFMDGLMDLTAPVDNFVQQAVPILAAQLSQPGGPNIDDAVKALQNVSDQLDKVAKQAAQIQVPSGLPEEVSKNLEKSKSLFIEFIATAQRTFTETSEYMHKKDAGVPDSVRNFFNVESAKLTELDTAFKTAMKAAGYTDAEINAEINKH